MNYPLVAAIGSLLVSMGGCSLAVHNMTQEDVYVKVTGKERITTNDGDGNVSSKYLVFTETETFENTDSLLAFKFNSSDIYGKLKEGQECRFKVVGWRVQFASMYRNILEAQCAP